MTPEEMDRKISQHLGDPKITDECEYCDGCGELGGESDAYHCPKCRGSGKGKPRYVGPRYSTDLNAMHEAEKTLTDHWDGFHFRNHLSNNIHATAAQRAEAFLRTVGKWRDQ